MPCVGDNNSLQETPYIISSKNPKTGAFSIATLPRTQCDRLFYEPRADVSAYVGESDVTIGVFGAYKSLSLRFDGDMSGVRVYGADLLAFADCEISHSKMTDITDKVKIVGDTIVFDGELIEKVGKALQSAGDRSSAGMVVSCVRRTQL